MPSLSSAEILTSSKNRSIITPLLNQIKQTKIQREQTLAEIRAEAARKRLEDPDNAIITDESDDDYNVCWDYLTAKGCGKGDRCAWKHILPKKQTPKGVDLWKTKWLTRNKDDKTKDKDDKGKKKKGKGEEGSDESEEENDDEKKEGGGKEKGGEKEGGKGKGKKKKKKSKLDIDGREKVKSEVDYYWERLLNKPKPRKGNYKRRKGEYLL